MQQLLAFSSGANAQQQQQQGDASQQAVRQLVESAARNTREMDARAMAALAGSRGISIASEGPPPPPAAAAAAVAAAAAAAAGDAAGRGNRVGDYDDLAWSTDSWDYDMPPLLDAPPYEDAYGYGMETGPVPEPVMRPYQPQQQQQQQVPEPVEGNLRSRAGLAGSSGGGSSSSAAAGPAAHQQQQQPGYGLEALRALLSETQQQRQSRMQSRMLRTAAGTARAEAASSRANAALRDALSNVDMLQHMTRMSTLFSMDIPDGGPALGLGDLMASGLGGLGGRFGGGLSYEQLVNLEDVKVCVPAAVLDRLPRRLVAARDAAAAAAGDDDGATGAAAAAGEVDE
jgi:hypothetical protein